MYCKFYCFNEFMILVGKEGMFSLLVVIVGVICGYCLDVYLYSWILGFWIRFVVGGINEFEVRVVLVRFFF